MEISTIEIKKIKASEGMVLTNGETYSSVGGEVYLGVNDSADNWREVPMAEYDAYLAEQEKLLEQQ